MRLAARLLSGACSDMTSSLRRVLLAAVPFALAIGCGPARTGARPADASTVTARDLENNADEPIEKVLQKKVPGLVVTRAPDGSLALRIRGASSPTGTDAPLYVLDEMPIEPGPGGALLGIDPYSIETIKVLKGPEAGIYGIRGFNGVIVITTKKAGKKTP